MDNIWMELPWKINENWDLYRHALCLCLQRRMFQGWSSDLSQDLEIEMLKIGFHELNSTNRITVTRFETAEMLRFEDEWIGIWLNLVQIAHDFCSRPLPIQSLNASDEKLMLKSPQTWRSSRKLLALSIAKNFSMKSKSVPRVTRIFWFLSMIWL